MKESDLFIEYNEATGKDLTAKEQEDPYLMVRVISTRCRNVSEEEINNAKIYFNNNKKCEVHICIDSPTFMYDTRTCAICGRFIAHI